MPGQVALSLNGRVKGAGENDEVAQMVFVWAGFAAFFVVALAVGLRLVALAARTGRAPELLIGLGVLGIGPVGFGLQTCAGLVDNPRSAEALAAAGAAALAIGIWAKLVFNCLVYRRASRVAQIATAVLVVGVGAHLLAQPLLGSFLAAARDVPLSSARNIIQAAALGWGAAEALAYWVRMRKRARLGLADPVLVNRFLMWGLSAAAAGLGTAVGIVGSLATGAAVLEMPAILASSSAFGLAAALGMWLAFAPPRAYVAWLAAERATA